MAINYIRRKNRQSGSFILEALISLLLFAIALIAMIGLASRSLSQTAQTKIRNDASNLASELISEMWVSASTPVSFATTSTPSSSAAWLTRVTTAIPGSTATVTVAAGTTSAQVTVQINWTDPKDATMPHFYRTTTEIVKNL